MWLLSSPPLRHSARLLSLAGLASPLMTAPTAARSLNFLTIQPTFTVHDWTLAKPLMEECLEATRREAGCLFYGWTATGDRPGDKLFCREGYTDAAAARAHLDAVSPTLQRMLRDGAASLDEISVHAPRSQLEACKDAFEPLGATFFEIESGFCSFSQQGGGVEAAQQICSIQPYLLVHDWAKARPLMDECVARSRNEDKCLWYGWTRSGDRIFCREAYTTGEGALEHLANVGAVVEKLTSNGVATVERFEFHAPAEDVAKCKEVMDPLGATYFILQSGFQKFESDCKY
ncbi:hypothetical protein AB1Y20_012201 [Prymnesium parvum]|uniref:ABM domain-containing protein n=1 Tax=Prymnesium parvum TaxID=97485 RepID=A0AB34IP40_PRYPA